MNNSINNKGNKKNKNKKKIEHWKIISFYLLVFDIIVVNFSYIFGLWLRFDFKFSTIHQVYLDAFYKFAPIYTLFCIIVFYLHNMYRSIWRFISIKELNNIFSANIITAIFQIVGITILFKKMPVSYYVIGMIVQMGLIIASRFSYRYYLAHIKRKNVAENQINVMLIGAGAACQAILKEIFASKENKLKAKCIIDDNSNKWGRFVEGVPVVGGRDDILENAKKYKIDQIFFVIPSASPENKRDILNICKETDCELKQLPGMYQFMNGEVKLNKMKNVAVEDLLGRDTIKVNMDEIFQYIKGKTILVTGGGGSIGSELCRQIAEHNPKQLVIFDIYENNAYEIEQELKRKYPDLNLTVLIGSVRDSGRINSVFEMYKPDIVYHAAAHKHVPLMEGSPCEAIKNNVIGTYKTAYAALKNGTQKFVLISTDKAVNPTNVMGASKRMCEMVIQSMNKVSMEENYDILPLIYSHKEDDELHDDEGRAGISEIHNDKSKNKTEFVAVRFGNVLGSNGSVIPLFKKQIENGGPVTVTHPDIIRYFMTIPEAVSLVLQAGTYAKGGEIFILDMGEPVKIDTLARNLIKLSGYKPDVDIKIMYTGLRPGEKLYEEKLMAEEGMEKTPNDLIHIGKPIPMDTKRFFAQLKILAKYSYNESDNITEMVSIMVPTYNSPKVDKRIVEKISAQLELEVEKVLNEE